MHTCKYASAAGLSWIATVAERECTARDSAPAHHPLNETRNPTPETRNPSPETRNPKPENRNPRPETRNQKPETRNPKRGSRRRCSKHDERRGGGLGIRNPSPESQNQKPETRNPKTETRNVEAGGDAANGGAAPSAYATRSPGGKIATLIPQWQHL